MSSSSSLQPTNALPTPPPLIGIDLNIEIFKILKSVVAKNGQDALNDITRKMVRDTLEANLGVDLSMHKHQIKESLALVLETHPELCDQQPQEEHTQPKEIKPKPKPKKRKKSTFSESSEIAPKRPKSNTGINVPLKISAQLADVVGSSDPISRPQIVKKIWEYIKAHNLQDPTDGRFILCDNRLFELFGKHQRISAFAMQKFVSGHVQKIESPPLPATVDGGASTASSVGDVLISSLLQNATQPPNNLLSTDAQVPNGSSNSFSSVVPIKNDFSFPATTTSELAQINSDHLLLPNSFTSSNTCAFH